MGFLRFTLHLIDFLAWPVLALGYPLFASIRAVETGSKYHMKKLVTYWTIFSLISLFEHIFEKLIEWVPLWPYIKLITICWLVIPQFHGACYLYQILIHPCFPVKWHDSISQFNSSCYVYLSLLCSCLSINLQTVTDWFNKPMEDPYLKNEAFLALAERYVEENGSDALEEIYCKQECEGSSPVSEDITVMEHMEKHEAAESNEVRSLKENPIQIEKKMTGVQVKEMVVPADAEEIKFPEITSSNKVQTEWTCAVCQMKTTSEQNLKSHLNGRKHRAKCEGLKTCKQMPKGEGSSPVTTKSNQLNQQQVKHADVVRSEHSAKEAAEPRQENLIQIEKKPTAMQIKGTALPAEAVESVKNVQAWWTCAVCQVTMNSEHDLKCHLQGRRHREKHEELKTCKKTAKTERSTTFTSKMPDKFKQEQVRQALAAQKKNSTNEKSKEKVQLGATWQHQKQMQMKKAGGATHNSKLWCSFCKVKCLGEIDMAAHLSGRKHLAKLQETMSCTGGT
ncbi:unnamed protein product [Withania somnifera]